MFLVGKHVGLSVPEGHVQFVLDAVVDGLDDILECYDDLLWPFCYLYGQKSKNVSSMKAVQHKPGTVPACSGIRVDDSMLPVRLLTRSLSAA